MDIEKRPLSQQGVNRVVLDAAGRDASLYERKQALYTSIQQQIEAEEHYPNDPIGQEDYMYGRVQKLAEHNAVDVFEAHNIFTSWIMTRKITGGL